MIRNPNNLKEFSKKQVIRLSLLILSAFLILLFFSFIFGSEVKSNMVFVVEKGEGLSQIIDNLKSEGLIKNGLVPKIYIFLAGREKKISAGTYFFSRGDNTVVVLNKLIFGRTESDDIIITIPEGFTIFDIDRRLNELGFAEQGEFIDLALNFNNTEGDFYFLPGETVSLEGYLFPDTYRIAKNTESVPRELIEKMLNNFESKAASMIYDSLILTLKNITGSVKKPQDIVIMASMLEKEVVSNKDMSLVAGILWKRLNSEFPLQVDASVIYGACVDDPSLKNQCDFSRIGVINYLSVDSEYNTYTRLGLPAGPISNPGIDAINAAINSTPSDYWFYLSARRDGGRTVFSRTLEEHNAAREKYL